MNDHPSVMLSDSFLRNFKAFMVANKPGMLAKPPGDRGAFDGMPKALSRRGGAYDEGGDITALSTIDEGQASALLEYLSGKLSEDDLEALRAILNENTQSAIEGQPTFSGSGSDARNRRIATDTILRREGRQQSRAAELFPELSRIKR
jgi:hypothetical protein